MKPRTPTWHEGAGGIGDYRQDLGEDAAARGIARGRHGVADRLVRALVIVDVAPAVEALLGVSEIAPGRGEHLELERAIEALVLAMALGMAGA